MRASKASAASGHDGLLRPEAAMTGGAELAIAAAGLTKRYGKTAALCGVGLQARAGTVTALLGPNGAGKSTLLRIVATVLRPTAGTVLWNGTDTAKDPDALRVGLGYLPQDSGVYPNLSAREFLRYIAALKNLPPGRTEARIDELLETLNLTSAGSRPLAGYSGGMKQRVGIAQALLNDPQLAVVDEPTVGLDPEERMRFRELIAGLAGDRVVLLSTHIVSDVETIAERVVMIAGGSVVADGAPDDLVAELQGAVWEGIVQESALAGLRLRYAVTTSVRRRDGFSVRVSGADAPPGFRPAAPTLEEAYMAKVQRSRAA
jgi:ABC-type multidrug transport system ATPase subunit